MLTSGPPDPDSLLVRRKLPVPPAPERLVMRERVGLLLCELIDHHPLVWVCASAGSGKTTAVAQAIPALDRPVAWLTLDDTDAAAGRLVTYLEATLGARADAARGVASTALAARLPHTEATALLAEAIGDTPVLLVIDELERIAQAPEALAVLAPLVRYAPAAMRIVMIAAWSWRLRSTRPRQSAAPSPSASRISRFAPMRQRKRSRSPDKSTSIRAARSR
jgi:ATP/maltotriose-dependent transcriptional regulator MalT